MSENIIKGKRILLLAPTYMNYYKSIIETYAKQGSSIFFYSTNPTNIFYTNFYLSRLRKVFPLLYKLMENNRNRLLERYITKNIPFDYILAIKCNIIRCDTLQKIKSSLSGTKFILYQWDSIRNFNYLDKIEFFDKVYSFDYKDCEQFPEIKYLPLFYIKEYSNITSNRQLTNDIYFLGTNHSIREQVLTDLSLFCDKMNISYQFNLKVSLSEKQRLKNTSINCFTTAKEFKDFQSDFWTSRVILDISSPNQSGLPFRIIEALAAGKKIITTNKYIFKEKFYSTENIFIIGLDDMENLPMFINTPFMKTDITEYSIENFTKRILC